MGENKYNDKSETLDSQNKETFPETASDFEFLQEKIKERPINKKKLFRRMVITASLAVLFGVLACLSFLLLEPILNNWLYPEEQPEIVTFPQEKDEMRPEDMLTEGTTTSQETEAQTISSEGKKMRSKVRQFLNRQNLLPKKKIVKSNTLEKMDRQKKILRKKILWKEAPGKEKVEKKFL